MIKVAYDPMRLLPAPARYMGERVVDLARDLNDPGIFRRIDAALADNEAERLCLLDLRRVTKRMQHRLS